MRRLLCVLGGSVLVAALFFAASALLQSRVVQAAPARALGPAIAATVAWSGASRVEGTVAFGERDYAVTITADGVMHVTESWDVRFSGGPFTHAFLAIDQADTTGITFGTVTGDTPGSQQTGSTSDSAGNPQEQVTWNFPATTDAERTFTIPYTITGALGVNSESAWLDWHYLDGGDATGEPVQQSKITITVPPAGANGEQAYTATASGSVLAHVNAGQPVQVTGTNLTSSQPLEVEVIFTRTALDASVQRPPWQTSDIPPTPPTPLQGAPSGNGSGGNTPNGGPYYPESGAGPGSGNGFSNFGAALGQLFGGFFCLGAIFLVLGGLFTGGRGRGPLGVGPVGPYNRHYGPWWGSPGYRGPWGGPFGGGFGGGMGGGMGGGAGGIGGGGGGASGFG